MPKMNDDLYKKALLYIESGRMDMASKPTKRRKIQLPNGAVVHVHEGVLDLIDRAQVMHDLMKKDGYQKSVAGMVALQKIGEAPSVDAVEVVRCKDCLYFTACEEIDGCSWTGFCEAGEFHTDEDDFCSRGVKKDAVD